MLVIFRLNREQILTLIRHCGENIEFAVYLIEGLTFQSELFYSSPDTFGNSPEFSPLFLIEWKAE